MIEIGYGAGKTDPIVEAVRTRLLARSLIGIEKYKKTLMRDDLSRAEWLRHL